ncbi:hypothetical protein CASFOL_020569 [Castilleja foliolosa]|uniref:Uncharacterized protein n=1 Tax=Castilleja foliolosa TaxID=1961234 RepID=A0ABD3D2Q9_9LAMI
MGKKSPKTGGGGNSKKETPDDGEEFSGGLASVLKKNLIKGECNLAIVQLFVWGVFKMSTKRWTKVALTTIQVFLCFARLWFYYVKNHAKGMWIRIPDPYELAFFFIATFSLVYFASVVFEYEL